MPSTLYAATTEAEAAATSTKSFLGRVSAHTTRDTTQPRFSQREISTQPRWQTSQAWTPSSSPNVSGLSSTTSSNSTVSNFFTTGRAEFFLISTVSFFQDPILWVPSRTSLTFSSSSENWHWKAVIAERYAEWFSKTFSFLTEKKLS